MVNGIHSSGSLVYNVGSRRPRDSGRVPINGNYFGYFRGEGVFLFLFYYEGALYASRVDVRGCASEGSHVTNDC